VTGLVSGVHLPNKLVEIIFLLIVCGTSGTLSCILFQETIELSFDFGRLGLKSWISELVLG